MLKRRDVEASLERKGFSRKEGDHAFFIYYTEAGSKTSVRTKTSHGTGKKDLGEALISLMAKQCKLTKADFHQLIECPLSRKRYEEKLRENGDL